MHSENPGGRRPERGFRPVRRVGGRRVARANWGAGRSVSAGEVEGRDLVVDRVRVTEEAAAGRVAGALGVAVGEPLCVRRRRYVLDGEAVLLATSYLPAALVAGTAVTEDDPGPGGVYARLAELGEAPARFREIRSRMPSREEADGLGLGAGTPVVLVRRTAFTASGRAVEVNDMVLDSAAYVLEYEFDA
ncbi:MULTISPECIES: GntR family transcriptional regulator [Streptomycetaceae]|uniref:GntR family regulatory protein n=1 Tax=Streptantibioticus cattleyicolor (strain ATCC 35852 / DSM 46488 / JCM 4925 / NBRC 14057 / NRRL 8057) TaxID=1003195 RepID=F8JR98_STREN